MVVEWGILVFHPNAYLADFRNVKPGLKARTPILNVLEKGPADARTIAEGINLTYRVVLYHLNLLESREIVDRKGGRPVVWKLTGFGQKKLQC